MREQGLNAAVYTQLTDVETECNGLVTYDRAFVKGDAARMAAANRGELPLPAFDMVVNDAQQEPAASRPRRCIPSPCCG